MTDQRTYTLEEIVESLPRSVKILIHEIEGKYPNTYRKSQLILAAFTINFFRPLLPGYTKQLTSRFVTALIVVPLYWVPLMLLLTWLQAPQWLVFMMSLLWAGNLWMWSKRVASIPVYVARTEKFGLQTYKFFLGRISPLIDSVLWACFAGVVLGGVIVQAFLIWNWPSSGGFGEIRGYWHSQAISLNNLCHGKLDSALSWVGIDARIPEALSTAASLVLAFFRSVFDGLLIALALLLWQRFQLRTLTRSFPRDGALPSFLAWLKSVTSDKANWGGRFHDEIVYLILLREYLSGNESNVRCIGEQFSSVAIDNYIRRLFIGSDGSLLLPLNEPENLHSTKGFEFVSAEPNLSADGAL